MGDTITADVKIDDALKTLEKYISVISKTCQRACNDWLFDIARIALKDTVKANTGDIRAVLNAGCDIDPKVSLAELLVIMRNRKEGNKEFNLKQEARALMNKRVGSAGYTRSGWIKPMVALLPYVGKGSLSVGGVSKNIGPGGANPVARPSSFMQGAVWNDVTAKTNDSKVTAFKEKGVQSAINKVNADKEAYLLKKLEPHNQEFNRG